MFLGRRRGGEAADVKVQDAGIADAMRATLQRLGDLLGAIRTVTGAEAGAADGGGWMKPLLAAAGELQAVAEQRLDPLRRARAAHRLYELLLGDMREREFTQRFAELRDGPGPVLVGYVKLVSVALRLDVLCQKSAAGAGEK
ncbi:MAG TPA: hypothetical protein VGI39_22545 [Polyangiaceae bacterium]